MGQYGSQNVKTLLLLQIASKHFQTSPKFSSEWSSQNYFGTFKIFSFRFLAIFLFENFEFTIIAYGETKSLNYLENGRL